MKMRNAAKIVDILLEADSRRDFLKRLGLAAAGVALVPYTSAAAAPQFVQMQRRFMGWFGMALDKFAPATLPAGYIRTASGFYVNPDIADSINNFYTEAGSPAQKTLERWLSVDPYSPESCINSYRFKNLYDTDGQMPLTQVDNLAQKRFYQNEKDAAEEKQKREQEKKDQRAQKDQQTQDPDARSRFDYAGGSEDTGYAQHYETRRPAKIVNTLLEALDPSDYLLGPGYENRNRHIKITFTQTTPESAEDGDFSDHGWIDEEGVPMEPDDIDLEDELTPVNLAVKFMKNKGACQQDNETTWSDESSTIDYRTGTDEQRSYHLYNFTDEELTAISTAMRLR